MRKKALRTCTLDIVGHCLVFGVPLPCLVSLFRKEEGRVRWCSADRGPEGRGRGVPQGYRYACFRTNIKSRPNLHTVGRRCRSPPCAFTSCPCCLLCCFWHTLGNGQADSVLPHVLVEHATRLRSFGKVTRQRGVLQVAPIWASWIACSWTRHKLLLRRRRTPCAFCTLAVAPLTELVVKQTIPP